MTTQRRALEVQRAAVVAAAGVFDAKPSYEAASMADLREATGLSQGGLTHHFGSKDGIAHAVVEEQHRRSITLVKAALENPDMTGLEAAIRLSFEFADQLTHDPVVRAGIKLTISNNDGLDLDKDPWGDWTSATEHLLRRAADTGEIVLEDMNPADLALLFAGSFIGIHLLSEHRTMRVDLADRLGDFWTFNLRRVVRPAQLPRYLEYVVACQATVGTEQPTLTKA
ncbi:TetR/AcrR family transcriptional regulator [Amycolatopsis anabasis]|uniref:TetR/AcrR family transcriptional regulator n=1 Tax=Amycolatopsis anabasis TaxID=1840409 RepID=UPI00131D050C|nr:TetR/AcrR family transcriptional regulator [Amycolatopsis anabasis]